MTPAEAKTAVERLISQGKTLCEIAKTAARGRQSLRGSGAYAEKFHSAVLSLSGTLSRLEPVFQSINADTIKATYEGVKAACGTLKSPDADALTRAAALKKIELDCHTVIIPHLDVMTGPAIPATEQVLSMSVVKGTKGYFEKMIAQANGCYERGWFDASSVMLRKFVEALIIEVYEHHNRANDLKNPADNNFHMLSKLVEIILADTAFNLARETKATLPLVKLLGDRSAHNRRYLATQPDVDKIIPGLRVLADDLLHLAALK